MQNWTNDVFAASHNAQTDLQNMENNFQTIKSLFEGTSAPANTVAGHPWFDSGKDLLRIRNAANASWYSLMHADASQEIWVYRNDAMSGWVINSNVVDKVLAIKGGSNAYNVTAGQTAGTWQQPGHALSEAEMPTHSHSGSGSTSSAGGHNHGLEAKYSPTDSNAGAYNATEHNSDSGYDSISNSRTTTNGAHSHPVSVSVGNAGSGYSHNHGSTFRPNAAVGTMQRMDV